MAQFGKPYQIFTLMWLLTRAVLQVDGVRRQAQLQKLNTKASFKVKSYSTMMPHQGTTEEKNKKEQSIFLPPIIESPLVDSTFFQVAKAIQKSDMETFFAKIGIVNKNDRDQNQHTLLYWAIEGENRDSITKLLLEMGFDVNAKNIVGSTPLMLASAMNSISCMKILLDHGADINAIDNTGNSAIQHACLYHAPDAVKLLLEKKIAVTQIEDPADSMPCPMYSSDVNKILLESGARVYLHISLPDKHSSLIEMPTEHIKIFLESYAHLKKTDGTTYTLEELLEKQDTRGLTMLGCAAATGKTETVKVLLDLGANINPVPEKDIRLSPLGCAAKKHLKCTELLIKAGAKVGVKELIAATQSGEVAIVQLLLEAGKVDVNSTFNGFSPLMSATLCGHLEVVKQLEKLGAKLDAVFSNPSGDLDMFCFAVLSGQEDTIKYFWKEKKMNTNFLAYAFYILVEKNEISTLEKLVEMGMDISQIGPYFVRPLYLAAEKNNVQAIELLAKAGANVNEYSANDSTPLIIAVKNGALEAVQCLIKLHVDVNVPDYIGFSPIGLAPTPEIMQILYDAGADVNNKRGIQPLSCFKMDKPELIHKLLDLGADINANGHMGTPIMQAAGIGNLPLVRFFMARGANPSGTIGIDVSKLDKEQQNSFNNMVIDYRLKKAGITYMAITAAGSGSGTLELVEECYKYETEKSGKLELGPLLVHTARYGVAPFVHQLLELGAPIDTITPPNDTSALHMAASNNKAEVVKILVQAGANRDLKTKDGKTALDIAKSKNYSEIVEMLEK